MELKYIGTSVIEFLLIPRVPLGMANGWIEMGVGMGVWGVSHAHMHVHTHTYIHTCILNKINMDTSILVAICNFYTWIHVCGCICVHVCACGDTLDAPRYPHPRAEGSPKHQNSISPELIEIIGFCLKILYLCTLLNSYRL